MKTSEKGRELIKKYEGFRADAYLCPAGVPTIGYGHTTNVKMGDHITEDGADRLLSQDIMTAEKTVNGIAGLMQSQFDALVSFVYNVGVAAFRSSTLYRKVAANPMDATIRAEFLRWTKANGRTLPGLVARRTAEANLYAGVEL